MIAPMKKFILVLLNSDARMAPIHLRKLGIAHVEEFQSQGEDCARLENALKKITTAKALLTSYAIKKTPGLRAVITEAGEIADTILEHHTRVENLQDRISELRREVDRIRDWGELESSELENLERGGIEVRLVECQPEQLNLLPSEMDYIRLSAPKGKVRLAILGGLELPQGLTEFKAPTMKLSALTREISETERQVALIRETLASFVAYTSKLDAEISRVESSLVVERLRHGMPGQEDLRYLQGYVPAKDAEALKAEASRRNWALALDDPSSEDMPPTKIENSPAVRIIQPVFDFLGTVPHYREYDISLSFLIFFSMYFAMIFGDGGYGVLMLAASFGMYLKSRKARTPLSDFGRLLFVLSGATIAWGFLTATWFALPFESLPPLLRTLSLPALNGGNPDSGTNTKILCFAIGAIQLALAHMKNIRRDFPNLKFLAQIGSLSMVIGMFNAVLNLVIDSARFPLYGWALALIGAGFALVFIFGNWDGNLIKSILEGLKGIIPTFLGTVSVFADIVSYIRLWAVGLAGLAISQTVNGMAGNMFGPLGGQIAAFVIGGLMGIILLFVGHTINFLMSVLSVIVHGIRLNMLEYSSHLGMEWSGYKYAPLGETADEGKSEENSI